MLPSPMFSSRSSSFPLAASSLRSNSFISGQGSVNSAPSVPSVLNSPSFFSLNSAPVNSIAITETPLTSLESALTQNPPVTPLECALSKNQDLKPFRMNTYEKTGARGPARPYIIVNQRSLELFGSQTSNRSRFSRQAIRRFASPLALPDSS